jgi:hypothetical protein
MTKDDARLAAVVLCALAGFILAAWASARWGLGDSCWVDAPMEQAQCRAVGGRATARGMCLTNSCESRIMFLRNVGFQKGKVSDGSVQASVQVGPGRAQVRVLQPVRSSAVEAAGGEDLP